MRIAIDIRPALRRPSGVGKYLIGLIEALSSIDIENEYLLFTSSLGDRFIPASIKIGRNFSVRDFPIPVRLINLLWHRFRFPPIELFSGKIDIAHSPSPMIIPTLSGRRLITLHDLYFLRRPELASGEVRRDYIPLVKKNAALADAVIADSRFTRDEAVELIGLPEEKVRVIPLGISRRFFKKVAENEVVRTKSLFGIDGDYFLFVGRGERRKNLSLLLSAFKMFLDKTGFNLHLVVAGEHDRWRDEIQGELNRLSLSANVSLLGYVAEPRLTPLYAGALALVYPSLYEGFGLPLLEAMAVGTPVIASDTSSIPEITGSAAFLIPPDDRGALAEAMAKLLSDPELRKDLIAKGRKQAKRFSWTSTAKKTLSLYKELI
jgi:glycosyltransferase involved in cell wall biosynthesis